MGFKLYFSSTKPIIHYHLLSYGKYIPWLVWETYSMAPPSGLVNKPTTPFAKPESAPVTACWVVSAVVIFWMEWSTSPATALNKLIPRLPTALLRPIQSLKISHVKNSELWRNPWKPWNPGNPGKIKTLGWCIFTINIS